MHKNKFMDRIVNNIRYEKKYNMHVKNIKSMQSNIRFSKYVVGVCDHYLQTSLQTLSEKINN